MGFEIFYPIFFHHKIFINGEQIFLNEDNIENIKQILKGFHAENNQDILDLLNLNTIRKIYGDLIPEDAIFFMNNREIKIDKEKASLYPLFQKSILNIFSPKFYIEQNIEHSSFSFSNLKILEKNEKYNLCEYPHKKEEIDYYSVIIFGKKDNNIGFVCGFLNFIFDIHENDPFRLIYEFQDETNNFIDIKFITSKKGNFKFSCINLESDLNQKHLEELLKFLENENDINLILFNMNGFDYNFFEKDDIIEKYLKLEESQKYEVFFSCPNSVHLILKLQFLQTKINFLDNLNLFLENKGNDQLLNEVVLQTAKIDEILRQNFFSCFFNYECIFDAKQSNNSFFLYTITMKGYSYFYNIIIDREKRFIDFSFFIYYLSIIKDKLSITDNKIKNLEEKKDKNSKEIYELENLKKNLLEQIKNKEEEIGNLERQLEDKNSDLNNRVNILNNKIEYLMNNKKAIQKKKVFFFPINSQNLEISNLYNEKTNVCHTCKFNCHKNCEDLSKTFCSSFNLNLKGFKCNFCPNKCNLDSHEIVSFQYPKYEYKKFDDILKQYINANQNKKKFLSSDLKVEYIIQKKREEVKKIIDCYNLETKEIEPKIESEKKNLEKMIIQKNDLEERITKMKEFSDNIYNKLKKEKVEFNYLIEHKIFEDKIIDMEKGKWYDILLIYMISFYIRKSFDTSSSSMRCGGGRTCNIF